MKSFKLLSVIALTVALFTSCVSRQNQGAPLTVDSVFDAIEVYNGVEVEYVPSGSVSYTVTASEDAKSKLRMKVNGGTLSIWAEDLRSKDKIRVRLSAPEPTSFLAYNNSKLSCNAPLKTDKLVINAWNNADVTLMDVITVANLDLTAYNNGSVDLPEAQCESIDIEAYNNADVRVAGFAGKLKVSQYNNSRVNTTALKVADIE